MDGGMHRITLNQAENPFGPMRVAVIVPCYNEAGTIAKVVEDFRNSLPTALIVVLDNASTDGTGRIAACAGARVIRVQARGKGNVVRRAFADVEADAYVLVDGDATYDASIAPVLVRCLFDNGLDMVVGSRAGLAEDVDVYRRGHRTGNRLLTGCVAALFGRGFRDLLSGYRVFSRRYAKSFPAHARGFEIETELSVHALQMRMPTTEVETAYRSRPSGSHSKLNTYRDGLRILGTIVELLKCERPLLFFGSASFGAFLISILLASPLLRTYLETGLVPRVPTAVLCAALATAAAILFACGLLLDTVTRGRREVLHLHYLSIPLRARDMEGAHRSVVEQPPGVVGRVRET